MIWYCWKQSCSSNKYHSMVRGCRERILYSEDHSDQVQSILCWERFFLQPEVWLTIKKIKIAVAQILLKDGSHFTDSQNQHTLRISSGAINSIWQSDKCENIKSHEGSTDETSQTCRCYYT